MYKPFLCCKPWNHRIWLAVNQANESGSVKYGNNLCLLMHEWIRCCGIKTQRNIQFSSVQSLSRVRLFTTPGTAVCQNSLSITSSESPPKPMSIELVMPSNHLILCRPFLLLPSIFPSIRVFSNESALRIRWPKYWL